MPYHASGNLLFTAMLVKLSIELNLLSEGLSGAFCEIPETVDPFDHLILSHQALQDVQNTKRTKLSTSLTTS